MEIIDIYIPSVEFDNGTLKYRSVFEYKDAWVHVVYTPKEKKLELITFPKLGMGDLASYETDPIDEYHSYDDEGNRTSWWRFRINDEVLKINLLEGDAVEEFNSVRLHVEGVAFAFSLEPAKNQ